MTYNTDVITVAGTGGALAALPSTGVGEVAWFLLAGFALVAAGTALVRILPRLRRR